MSDSCVKYVQDELIRYKDSLQCIQDDIRSSEIELKTIEKNLNKLIKEKDWTEDILHSTSISSKESDVRILTLKNNKSDHDINLGIELIKYGMAFEINYLEEYAPEEFKFKNRIA